MKKLTNTQLSKMTKDEIIERFETLQDAVSANVSTSELIRMLLDQEPNETLTVKDIKDILLEEHNRTVSHDSQIYSAAKVAKNSLMKKDRSNSKKEQVIKLFSDGMSRGDIAEQLETNYSYVITVLQQNNTVPGVAARIAAEEQEKADKAAEVAAKAAEAAEAPEVTPEVEETVEDIVED